MLVDPANTERVYMSPEQRTSYTAQRWEACWPEARRLALQYVADVKRRSIDRAGALQLLYAKVPPTGCEPGACADSCTGIELSPLEYALIEKATGVPEDAFKAVRFQNRTAPAGGCDSCPLLTADKLCGAYTLRPMLCRLFGVTPEMGCEHCQPQRILTTVQGFALLIAAQLVGGDEDWTRQVRERVR